MLITDKNVQFVFLTETDSDFRRIVNLDDGTNLTTMLKYKGVYFGLKTAFTRWNSYSSTSLWHPEQIRDLGEDGKFIIGMMKFDKLWTVFRARNTGIISQNIAVFDDWDIMKDHISTQWSAGMDITDLYNDDGNYYVVMSSGLNWKQSYVLDVFPEEEILKKAEEGSFITEIMPVGKKYLWVFSANTGYSYQDFRFVEGREDMDIVHKALSGDEGFHGCRATLVRNVFERFFFVFLK